MTNGSVGRIFGLIADLLELKGGDDAAKASAYRRAARSVEAFPETVATLHEQGRLREIPGVGEALAKKIGELVETGRLRYFERLNSEMPSGVLDLLRVPGVGTKTASLVWREMGIDGVDRVEEAARSGALARLPGLGPKKVEAILEGIASYRRAAGRHPLGLARPVGLALADGLAALPGVEEAALAGSVRRWRDTVGNLNLVAATTEPEAVADAFAAFPEVREVTSREAGHVVALLHYGLVVDLRLVPPDHFGAALAYYTGSPAYNERLAERAAEMGLSLGPEGFARIGPDGLERSMGEPVAAAAEDDVFAALGLPTVPPELREVEGDLGQPLPALIEAADVRGDLHVHSTWSDGLLSLEDLAAAGARLGYEYLAVSDHTKSLAIARGLDEKRIAEQGEAIAAVNDRAQPGECRLLRGVEVDILAGGSLDLPDAALADLDIVTASIHSQLRRPGPQITERLVAAAKNEHVDVLGHPSGRLLGSREASELDLGAVLEVAAKTGTLLEINASPERLDLRDEDARRARQAGCRLTVSTDAHNVHDLDHMPYGVAVARRARLGPGDVANTRRLPDLLKILGR